MTIKTCTENWVKFEGVVLEVLRYASGQTNRHTYRPADSTTSHPCRGQNKETVFSKKNPEIKLSCQKV